MFKAGFAGTFSAGLEERYAVTRQMPHQTTHPFYEFPDTRHVSCTTDAMRDASGTPIAKNVGHIARRSAPLNLLRP